MICSKCGKAVGRLYPDQTCQGCYNYFRNGGTINKLPDPGEIKYDDRGFVICHICGRAFKRLGSHIRESHAMTIDKYKERFGLCNCSKTTELGYQNHMRELSYKNGMPLRLMESGVNTRIQKGDRHLRYGKQARLQERLDKSKRYKKN